MMLIIDLEELMKVVIKLISNIAAVVVLLFFLWLFVSWFSHGCLGLPAGSYNFFTILVNLF